LDWIGLDCNNNLRGALPSELTSLVLQLER
jgi:hypothetical protein